MQFRLGRPFSRQWHSLSYCTPLPTGISRVRIPPAAPRVHDVQYEHTSLLRSDGRVRTPVDPPISIARCEKSDRTACKAAPKPERYRHARPFF